MPASANCILGTNLHAIFLHSSSITSPRSQGERTSAPSLVLTGEMRQRVREFDWSHTPLGDARDWPRALTATLELVLGSAFPTILLWGPDLVQLYNDAYREIMGRKHPSGLGLPTAVCWPEVWHINGPIYHRVLQGETVSFEDARYPLERDGTRVEDVYLTISYSPARDDDGRIAGVFITMLETTSRVRANAFEAERERLVGELRVERARLEEIFRQAPAFLAVVHGPDHVFTLVNDAYYQLVGHRALIGKPVSEAIPEAVGQGFVALLDTVLRTGEPFVGRELPIMLERTPGAPSEQCFLDFVYYPLTGADGTRTGIVAHGSDITDQALARRELERVNMQLEQSAANLRASEQRLRELFDQAPVAVAVLTGPEHRYTIANPHYQVTPGSGRHLLGLPVREAFPELVDQGFFEMMDEVFRTGTPYFARERLVRLDRNRDGVVEDYFYNIGYQPLRDGSGTVYAIASVAYEVTEQIRARTELEQAREAAERARLEAEEANLAKSRFLTTMSHELRTPLNAVSGYADLLLMEIRGKLEEGQREDLERIKRSGQHLLSLINDVLNFAKLDAGQVEFHSEDVSVAPLLESLEDLIRPQVVMRGLNYIQRPCSAALVMRADPEKVRQILLNLLANGIKFTESGGELSLSCHARESMVEITVEDTGRGIPEDQLALIFDPFVQVDRHLTPQSQQGVGLGLSISRDLAAGMGGTLTVASVVGRGSAFTLTLPRVRSA